MVLANFYKIIVLSDIHITAGGKKIIGLDPAEKLRQALKHILKIQKDANRIVFTGDLAHDGTVEEYLILEDLLKDVEIPITFMMGNHDRREAFCEVFPSVKLDEYGFLQSAISYEDHTLLFLDTLNFPFSPQDKNKGFLCNRRLTWLESQLELAKGKKVILFMHHPAFSVGFKAMDKIRLMNSGDLFYLLDKHKNAIHIVSGHIHRTISGNFHGYGFSIFKSTCHQMPLMFDSDNVKLSAIETPAYGILCLVEKGVIVHSEDYELVKEEEKVFDSYTKNAD